MKPQYTEDQLMTTDDWGEEFKLKEFYETAIVPNLKVFAPKVLEELEKLEDSDKRDLIRVMTIMTRQWYNENTIE